jgi:hypothetical protein
MLLFERTGFRISPEGQKWVVSAFLRDHQISELKFSNRERLPPIQKKHDSKKNRAGAVFRSLPPFTFAKT